MAPAGQFALTPNRSLIPRPAGPVHSHSTVSSSDGSTSSGGSSGRLSAFASKLVSGVNPVSPQEAHRRWNPPPSPNNEPRVSSNYRPRQEKQSRIGAPLTPRNVDAGNSKTRITASAFAAAKEERSRAAERSAASASPSTPRVKSPLPSASHSASPSKTNKYASPNPNVAASRPFAPREKNPGAAAARHRASSHLAKSNIHSTDGGGGVDENSARRGSTDGNPGLGLGRPEALLTTPTKRHPTPGSAIAAAIRATPSPPASPTAPRRTSYTRALGASSPYNPKRASPGGPDRSSAKLSAPPALSSSTSSSLHDAATSPNPSFDLSYYAKAGFPTPTLESLVAAASANDAQERRSSWGRDAGRALGLNSSQRSEDGGPVMIHGGSPLRKAGSSAPAVPQTVASEEAQDRPRSAFLGRPFSRASAAGSKESLVSVPYASTTPGPHTPQPQEPFRRPGSRASPSPVPPSPTKTPVASRPVSYLAPSTDGDAATPRSSISLSTDHASAHVVQAHREALHPAPAAPVLLRNQSSVDALPPPTPARRPQTPESRAATPNGSPRKGPYAALHDLVTKASSAALREKDDEKEGSGIDKAMISSPMKSPRKGRSRAQSMISVFTRCNSSDATDSEVGVENEGAKEEQRGKKGSVATVSPPTSQGSGGWVGSPGKRERDEERRKVEGRERRERYLSGAGRETEKQRVDREFEKLMQGMQIPDAVRVKMAGLDHPVKSAMLKGSFSATLSSHSFLATALQLSGSAERPTPGGGKVEKRPKRSKSGSDLRGLNILGLGLGGRSKSSTGGDWCLVDTGAEEVSTAPPRNGGDKKRHAKSASVATALSASTTEEHGPAWWALRLKANGYRDLDAGEMKRLRVSLRTQAPSWTAEFVVYGGYVAMMKRLKELLEVEWREEQHDDQVLFELLRCFKALLLTDPGKEALMSTSPSPFVQLVELLYSDKKPGDLACRQLLVEMVHGIFDLFPPSAGTLTDDSGVPRSEWGKGIQLTLCNPKKPASSETASSAPLLPPASGRFEGILSPPMQNAASRSNLSLPPTPAAGQVNRPSAHALVRSLLMGPPDAKVEATVDFMNETRRPRLFKKLVVELSGVLMDYFWIFCHSDNKFWDVKKLDEDKIEAPKVPSGMTGGVEYEAMVYCTTVMRLINEIGRTCPSQAEARMFHSDLFLSGIERCLLTLRKCSTAYYPGVHLELARYVALARGCGFDVPANTLRWLAGITPDEYLLKSPVRSAVARIEQRQQVSSQQGSPVAARR